MIVCQFLFINALAVTKKSSLLKKQILKLLNAITAEGKQKNKRVSPVFVRYSRVLVGRPHRTLAITASMSI